MQTNSGRITMITGAAVAAQLLKWSMDIVLLDVIWTVVGEYNEYETRQAKRDANKFWETTFCEVVDCMD